MFVRAGDAGLAAALFALASRPDRRDMLPSLSAPVAVVVGDADVLTPPDRAREIAEAVPRGDLTVLPGVGHMSALEAPEEVAAALLRLDEDPGS
jgi:pimeloyl-ACP methyl ester carboxylesterase